MVFIRDTEQSLKAAVYLVNTLPGFDDDDTLQTIADFESYLAVNPYTGAIRRDETELAAVRAIRPPRPIIRRSSSSTIASPSAAAST